MANKVFDIVNGITTSIGTTLGSGWELLRYGIEPLENDLVTTPKGYSVRPGRVESISKSTSMIGHYSANQEFRILLARPYKNQGMNDSKQRAVEEELFEKAQDIITAAYITKFGVSEIINVNGLNIEEIEHSSNENLALLTLTVSLLYRYPVTK